MKIFNFTFVLFISISIFATSIADAYPKPAPWIPAETLISGEDVVRPGGRHYLPENSVTLPPPYTLEDNITPDLAANHAVFLPDGSAIIRRVKYKHIEPGDNIESGFANSFYFEGFEVRAFVADKLGRTETGGLDIGPALSESVAFLDVAPKKLQPVEDMPAGQNLPGVVFDMDKYNSSGGGARPSSHTRCEV